MRVGTIQSSFFKSLILLLKEHFTLQKQNGQSKLITYFTSQHNVGRVIKLFPFIGGAMWQYGGGRADSAQPFQQFNWMPLGAVSVEHFP